MTESINSEIKKLSSRLDEICAKLDIGSLSRKLRELEAETLKPNFWNNQKLAQNVMKQISQITDNLDKASNLKDKILALLDLISLANDESSEDQIEKDVQKEIKNITEEIDQFEIVTYLSAEYDQEDAIVSIHAGQGGVEAMDWVAMLERMYFKYIASKNWKVEIINEIFGEEAGFKSVSFIASGPYSFGYLKNEAGVHRLVRQSPFNADNLRQTSFALVEVLPVIDDEIKVEIKDEDLEFEAFRSGGHGGQNVNKVSTAVRIKHIPTGIVVTCQSQRYQAQNRENALKLLRAKLWQLEKKELDAKKEELKGEYVIAGWGNQTRSYVLHPYKLVKDVKTGHEESDAQNILDGNLEKFIQSALKKTTSNN